MSPVVDAVIVGAALLAFILGYLAVRVTTRPGRVAAEPATLDLGAEPPAVVSLLVNTWELTEDAAESTMLDLAARGYLELRQPGNDPRQTTVHVTDRAVGDLLPFEKRVWDRINQVAVGGVVPVTALLFRDPGAAERWDKALRVEVVAEARRLGLSQRRFSPPVTTALTVGAFTVATVVFGVILHLGRAYLRPPSWTAGVCVGAFAWLVVTGVLGGLAVSYPGERDTAPGRAAAARWLGVRRWLRAHEGFADLPPAAVAVWDRYLSYGAALGSTRVASSVLGFGTANRRRLWSSYGGTWHRVRVRYPRLWPHYGRRAGDLAKPAAKAFVIGTVLLVLSQGARNWIPALVGPVDPGWFDLFEPVAIAVGAVLVPVATVRLLQVLFDVTTQRTITGEVLWTEPWPHTTLGRPLPGRWYLAVDDGTSDRTTAWAMPAHLSCRIGDQVRITARRWTRRVVDLSIVEHSRQVAVGAAPNFADLDPPKAS